MRTATLGTNGPEVSALGIGTWAWGDRLFWGYGSSFGTDDVRGAFDAAIACGITFFDTAEVYGPGVSETLLGEFAQQVAIPVNIATKYGPLPWRLGKDAVAEALSGSLQRLQRDRVTLYQVHWPFAFLMSQETLMDALADEVERGRVGAVGVSNYSAEQMRQSQKILSDRGIPLAVNQVRYSLLDRQIETNGVLETARELGVTILAYSPLAQGLLTGKYAPDRSERPREGGRRFDSRFSAAGLRAIAPLVTTLRQLAETYSKTPAQIALNWLVAQDDVVPIPGAKNAKQAEQNAAALGWNLSADDVEILQQVSRPWREKSR